MDISTYLFLLVFLLFSFGLLSRYIKQLDSVRYSNIPIAIGWILFGGFWISRYNYYAFKTRSIVYFVLIPSIAILCFLASLTAVNKLKSNESLSNAFLSVTRATVIASILYLPFTLVDFLRKFSIEFVAFQVFYVLRLLGVSNVSLSTGPEFGYQSALLFTTSSHQFVTYIAQNCTGIGSIALLISVILTTNKTTYEKAVFTLIGTLIIYVLNIIRNVFIALAFGHQWFKPLHNHLAPVLGYTDPGLVSFFIADKVISQIGSAAVLLLLFYILVKESPEVQEILLTFKSELYTTYQTIL